MMLFSCGEIPLKEAGDFRETGTIKKSKRKREITKDSTVLQNIKHDTIIKSDTVTIEKPIAYTCKHPDLVQKILLEKRTKIFEKEGRDINYYSVDFLDIFDIRKTKPEILMFYDKMIDSALPGFSSRGKIDFSNISNNVKPIIK